MCVAVGGAHRPVRAVARRAERRQDRAYSVNGFLPHITIISVSLGALLKQCPTNYLCNYQPESCITLG